jgi:hypothetical protein
MDYVVAIAIVTGLVSQPLSMALNRAWIATVGLAIGMAGVVGLYFVLQS